MEHMIASSFQGEAGSRIGLASQSISKYRTPQEHDDKLQILRLIIKEDLPATMDHK